MSSPSFQWLQVVLSDKESDAEIYVAPDIETKEVVYKFDELELSQNNFPMIPITDKEHLKKIVINCTASSSTGSSWYCGGGGLCFNQAQVHRRHKDLRLGQQVVLIQRHRRLHR